MPAPICGGRCAAGWACAAGAIGPVGQVGGQVIEARALHLRQPGGRAAQRLEPADDEAVGPHPIAREHLETMRDHDEGVLPRARRMGDARAHLGRRHGANLRRAEPAGPVGDARHRQLAHPMQPRRADHRGIGGDPAFTAQIGGVDAAVPRHPDRRQCPQRIVVRAEIAGAERGDRRRTRFLQQPLRQSEQDGLVRQRKVADIAPLPPLDRGPLGPLQPFAVNVHLHFMPARHDRPDHLGQKIRPMDQRRHGIEEEHALEAMALQQVHLPADAERALVRLRPDRPTQILGEADPPLMQRSRQFGIDGDEQRSHGAIRCGTDILP
ncbi:MAG: hypothetical protein WBL20_19120 [Sphingobium sp.]|uniref:hypothetical protein n=1 Tax=Sphingobium sp. TaxID=1912891 RepID=UPI003BB1C710